MMWVWRLSIRFQTYYPRIDCGHEFLKALTTQYALMEGLQQAIPFDIEEVTLHSVLIPSL